MIVTPTTASDVWQWATAHASPPRRREYRGLLAQVGVGEVLTYREEPGGVPLVILGFVDVPGIEGEVFFLGPPDGVGGLGKRILPIWYAAREWLRQSAESYPDGVICHVRVDNTYGARLVGSLGFRRTGNVVQRSYEEWRLTWRRKSKKP